MLQQLNELSQYNNVKYEFTFVGEEVSHMIPYKECVIEYFLVDSTIVL